MGSFVHERRRTHSGRGAFRVGPTVGWVVFALIVVAAAAFLYKTYGYYRVIKSGKVVDLPQFDSRLTGAGSVAAAPTGDVDVAFIEGGDRQPTLGTDHPELTVVEFADFECPFSEEEHAIVRRLAIRYGDRVRFVYRDFPIQQLHLSAYDASLAGECATEQGKFWPFHDKMYANVGSLDQEDLVRYSEEVGMDSRQFARCLQDRRYDAQVSEDLAAAKKLGLRGTPTFFFNGKRVDGAIPEADFVRIIESFLK